MQDHCVHGGGTLGPVVHQFATDAKPDEMEVASWKIDPASTQPESCSVDPMPEGRVHGGRMLARLSRDGSHASVGNSESGASVMMAWM